VVLRTAGPQARAQLVDAIEKSRQVNASAKTEPTTTRRCSARRRRSSISAT
jgi:hypothetical protein